MNRQDVANLALRIAGLYALMCALVMLSYVFTAIESVVRSAGFPSGPAGQPWLFIAAAGVPFVILTVSGLVLLLAAPTLARRIFPTTEHTGDPVRFLGLHAFAYSVIGLFVTIRGLTGLPAGIFMILEPRRSFEPLSWATIVRYFAPSVLDLALGLALFFGSHGLVRIWTRLRYAGLRRQMCLCVHCGYDLTGNTSGICPECGTPIGQPPSAS